MSGGVRDWEARGEEEGGPDSPLLNAMNGTVGHEAR